MKFLSGIIFLAIAVSGTPLFGQTTRIIVGPTVRVPLTGTQAFRMQAPVTSPIAPMVSHPIQPMVQSPYINYGQPQVSIPATVIIIPERRHVARASNPPGSEFHQRPARTPGTTIIVPNSTVVLPHAGGPPVFHTFPFAPQPATILPSSPVFVSPVASVPIQGSPAILVEPDLPPKRHIRPPAIGTSRGDVIFQLGKPIGMVGTPTTETLFFEGGVMVVLQDGRVVQIR